MSLHFFSIPALNGHQEQEAFNRFCATHSVLVVEHHLVQAGTASFWAVAVTLRDGPKTEARTGMERGGAKIDYKEILSEADFAVFSTLRELRKETAQRDGVAVFTVFTNEQLAAMVTGRVTTLGALRGIEGIGESRAAKYGALFLESLRAAFATPGSAA